MKWVKLNRQGQVTGNPKDAISDKGVWIASLTLPHTDQQMTAEYFAVDGVIMLPRICYNGQDRAKAREEARSHL